MEHPKKELIKEIADLLEDYQEAYVPGEWESFSKIKKKKYPFLRNWMKIAAVFLLTASVLPFAFRKLIPATKPDSVAVLKPVVKNDTAVAVTGPVTGINTDTARKTIALARIGRSTTEGVKRSAAALSSSHAITDPVAPTKMQSQDTQSFLGVQEKNTEEQYARTGVKPVEAGGDVNLVNANIKPRMTNKDTLNDAKREQLSTAEFLMAESRNSGKVLKKKDFESKWDFGLEVMPAATSANVNIGAGLTTAYRLSDKFSLSAGISYLQMEAGGSVSPQGNGNQNGVSAFSEKKLLSVDANLKAIDIPIALIYKLNKHYYTSAGISYFNVVSEKRNNTFEQSAQVEKVSYDPESGHPSTFKAISVEQVDEPALGKHLKGNSYIGFFNFSIGRQQNLFNKYKIRIEPFIKIPVGKLSSEDLRLTNSGIKFQLAF
ncbi:hypothetical protein H7F33_04500 [Pedobacter sp. PAMC26386]|nr:hypothetical protein H7F33_04500 [Pedobacter sp. PAMC26386]